MEDGFTTIKLDAKPGDALLFQVEVGNMPPKKIVEYLAAARNVLRLKKILPDTVKTLFAAMRNGEQSLTVERICAKPGDVIKFNVEIGKMPPHMVKQHIEYVKKMLTDPVRIFPEGVHLMIVPMRDGVPTAKVEIEKA